METNKVSLSHFINKVLPWRYSLNSLSIKKTRSPTSTDMLHQSGLSVVRYITIHYYISSILKNVNQHSDLVSEVIWFSLHPAFFNFKFYQNSCAQTVEYIVVQTVCVGHNKYQTRACKCRFHLIPFHGFCLQNLTKLKSNPFPFSVAEPEQVGDTR